MLPRDDLSVLPADDPQKPIGWTVGKIYSGAEIYLDPGHENYEFEDLKPITTRDGIKEGDAVLVPTLWGSLSKMIIRRNRKGHLAAYGKRFMSFLQFARDDRKAWVSQMMVKIDLLDPSERAQDSET